MKHEMVFVRLKNTLLLGFCFLLLSCSKAVLPENNPEALIQKAQEYSKQSTALYEQAIQFYADVLKTTKNPEAIHENLGRLFFEHSDYEKAAQSFLKVPSLQARRWLAISYYKAAKFTEALAVFNQLGETGDDEYLYYFALCCEQHHLYDQALKLYSQIQKSPFVSLAQERIRSINALAEQTNLQSLDPKIRELILKSPSQEDFPQANAVHLFIDEVAEVKEDNTEQYTYHYITKILNERGKDQGEVQVHYDSTYETVDIELARVIRPDGQIFSVGAKHIRDVSLYTNFPLYSNARVKIISMPEIAPGCVIEYQVTQTRSKMVAKNKFSTEYLLQSSDPIQQAKFTVILPKGRVLHQKILNEQFNTIKAELKPKVSSLDNKDVYTWEFREIPQILPEPQMPPSVEITPVILLSTFDSWDEIYDWWRPLAFDKFEANVEMKEKIKALTQNTKTLMDQVRAIYNFCSRDIRYVAIEYGQAGHEPHKAIEIFNNKYGDCKDKAILLISMLKEIGVKAYPVLIGTKGLIEVSQDFPTLIFNHCIAIVEIDKNLVFLDPTGETVLYGDLPAGDQARNVFSFFETEGKLITTPRYEAAHNILNTKTTFNFKDDESIEGIRRVETSGVYDQSQRWYLRYTIPMLIEDDIKGAIQQSMPGGRMKTYKMENLDDNEKTIVLSYEFLGSDFLIKAGNQKRVAPSLGTADATLASRETRQYAIDFDLPSVKRKTVELNLSDYYRVISLPEKVIEDTPWFRYESQYQYQDKKIVFIEEKTEKPNRIEPKDYAQFKSVLEKLSRDIKQCIILERTRP